MLHGAREAGCMEWWLPYAVTLIDRFHCTWKWDVEVF